MKKRLQSLGLLLAALVAGSCGSMKTSEIPMKELDPHSYAIPAEASVKHLDWTATVDFQSQMIRATAAWKIEQADGVDSIRFDTKDLIIKAVTLDDRVATEYRLAKADPILGQALVIAIKPGTRTVRIEYETNPRAEALQWLSPQQTAGKNSPFLFTQSQAILARSWVPCQDTPGVRFTYTADVTVPNDLLALMSASNPKEKNPSGEYHFEMKQPIPSYLLALAVGDLIFSRSANSQAASLIRPSSA